MNRTNWLVLTGLVLVLGMAALAWGRIPEQGTGAELPPAPAIGHPAPDFTLTTLEGQEVNLAGWVLAVLVLVYLL